MEIRKVGLGTYDPHYVQALRAELARSIKPNAFRETSEAVHLALLLADLIQLSPEAKLLLKKLRTAAGDETEEVDWMALLRELKEKRNGGSGQSSEGENSRLNLITLPVMRPPLPEVLPRENSNSGKKQKKDNEVRLLLSKMIVRSPNAHLKELLIDELEPLKLYVVNACKNFGVHILLLGKKERISDLRIHGMALAVPGEKTLDGRLKDHVRGFYYEDRRLIVLGEEQIGFPNHRTGVHEFAHAYDHTFSEKHYQMHYLSTQLWNLFGDSRGSLISSYAGISPAEYFAESMEGYFLPAKKGWLKHNDPQMYEFLSNLFG